MLMVKRRLGAGKLHAPCSGRNCEGSWHQVWFGDWHIFQAEGKVFWSLMVYFKQRVYNLVFLRHTICMRLKVDSLIKRRENEFQL